MLAPASTKGGRGFAKRQPGIPPPPLRYLGHVGEPLEDGVDAFKVVGDSHVGDPVVVHDLHSAQLVVRRVDFPAQDLPQRPTETALSSDSKRSFLAVTPAALEMTRQGTFLQLRVCKQTRLLPHSLS